MHKRKTLLAVVGSGVLFGGLASAQGVVEYRTQRFHELDANHDGRVTPAELNDHPGNFRALDRDGDGLITLDEFVNRSGPAPDPVVVPPPVVVPAPVDTFTALDRNRNGVISRGEWQGDALTFARLDRNDDQRITREEYLNPAASDTRENAFQSYDRNRDGSLSRWEWRGQGRSFEDVDRNNDGRISLREYLSPPRGTTPVTRFRDMDYDGNGVLTVNEWPGSRSDFNRLDQNGDRQITGWEFRQSPLVAPVNRFRDMDYDSNGVLTVNEWQGSRSDFNRLDQNGDRQITSWEFRQSPLVAPVNRSSFTTYDRNRDGYIESYEWTGSRSEFYRLDRNGDGRLSRFEYSM
jgi:Ca2+-binding EF-hand superfamily protein